MSASTVHNTIKSVVSTIITGGNTRPTMEQVNLACSMAGIAPPSSEASLAAMLSNIRKELGIAPLRRTRSAAIDAPAAIDEYHNYDEHHHEEHTAETEVSAVCSIPSVDPTIVIPDEVKALFNAFHVRTKLGHRPKMLIAGPAGCGKSSLAKEFAARCGRPYFEFYVPNVRESRDWFGSKGIGDDGRPKWFESLFVKALRTENAVILLDELNRCQPSVGNVLLPLLDHRAGVYFEEMGTMISCAKQQTWFCTANEGRKYQGTFALDAAFKDRITTRVEVTYLNESAETNLLVERTGISKLDASRLVEIAGITRIRHESDTDHLSYAMSTRGLIESAFTLVHGGANAKKTLLATIASHFSPSGGENSERASVISLIIGKFGDLNG